MKLYALMSLIFNSVSAYAPLCLNAPCDNTVTTRCPPLWQRYPENHSNAEFACERVLRTAEPPPGWVYFHVSETVIAPEFTNNFMTFLTQDKNTMDVDIAESEFSFTVPTDYKDFGETSHILRECEGSCTSHSDCEGDLQCIHQTGSMTLNGCASLCTASHGDCPSGSTFINLVSNMGQGLCTDPEEGIRVYEGSHWVQVKYFIWGWSSSAGWHEKEVWNWEIQNDNPGNAAVQENRCMNACIDQATPKANGPWSSRGPALGFSVNSNGRCYCNHKKMSDCGTIDSRAEYKYFESIYAPRECFPLPSLAAGACVPDLPDIPDTGVCYRPNTLLTHVSDTPTLLKMETEVTPSSDWNLRVSLDDGNILNMIYSSSVNFDILVPSGKFTVEMNLPSNSRPISFRLSTNETLDTAIAACPPGTYEDSHLQCLDCPVGKQSSLAYEECVDIVEFCNQNQTVFLPPYEDTCLYEEMCVPTDANFTCACWEDISGPLCKYHEICGKYEKFTGGIDDIYNASFCEACPQHSLPTADDNTRCVPRTPCDTNACLNGGTCTATGMEDWVCTCTGGYTGRRCEDGPGAPCPCLNGGTCVRGVCECEDGFIGDICEYTTQCGAGQIFDGTGCLDTCADDYLEFGFCACDGEKCGGRCIDNVCYDRCKTYQSNDVPCAWNAGVCNAPKYFYKDGSTEVCDEFIVEGCISENIYATVHNEDLCVDQCDEGFKRDSGGDCTPICGSGEELVQGLCVTKQCGRGMYKEDDFCWLYTPCFPGNGSSVHNETTDTECVPCEDNQYTSVHTYRCNDYSVFDTCSGYILTDTTRGADHVCFDDAGCVGFNEYQTGTICKKCDGVVDNVDGVLVCNGNPSCTDPNEYLKYKLVSYQGYSNRTLGGRGVDCVARTQCEGESIILDDPRSDTVCVNASLPACISSADDIRIGYANYNLLASRGIVTQYNAEIPLRYCPNGTALKSHVGGDLETSYVLSANGSIASPGTYVFYMSKVSIDGNLCRSGRTELPQDYCEFVTDDGDYEKVCVTTFEECDCGCLHGACVNGTCNCHKLWSGSDCSTPYICSDTCVHGTCEHELSACECEPGWEGDACDTSINDCTEDICGNGICADSHQGVECECFLGWYPSWRPDALTHRCDEGGWDITCKTDDVTSIPPLDHVAATMETLVETDFGRVSPIAYFDRTCYPGRCLDPSDMYYDENDVFHICNCTSPTGITWGGQYCDDEPKCELGSTLMYSPALMDDFIATNGAYPKAALFFEGTCEMCPVDSYYVDEMIESPILLDTTCAKCPSGKLTLERGSIGEASCVDLVCNEEHSNGLDVNGCICHAGYETRGCEKCLHQAYIDDNTVCGGGEEVSLNDVWLSNDNITDLNQHWKVNCTGGPSCDQLQNSTYVPPICSENRSSDCMCGDGYIHPVMDIGSECVDTSKKANAGTIWADLTNQTATLISDGSEEALQLNACEGVCLTDLDCFGNLLCHHVVHGESQPNLGCRTPEFDYCYDVEFTGDRIMDSVSENVRRGFDLLDFELDFHPETSVFENRFRTPAWNVSSDASLVERKIETLYTMLGQRHLGEYTSDVIFNKEQRVNSHICDIVQRRDECLVSDKSLKFKAKRYDSGRRYESLDCDVQIDVDAVDTVVVGGLALFDNNINVCVGSEIIRFTVLNISDDFERTIGVSVQRQVYTQQVELMGHNLTTWDSVYAWNRVYKTGDRLTFGGRIFVLSGVIESYRSPCVEGCSEHATCLVDVDGDTICKSPCDHRCSDNGKCTEISNSAFACDCPGFEGETCAHDVNECDSNPCGVGTCENTYGDYVCTCPQGYQGVHSCLAIDPLALGNIRKYRTRELRSRDYVVSTIEMDAFLNVPMTTDNCNSCNSDFDCLSGSTCFKSNTYKGQGICNYPLGIRVYEGSWDNPGTDTASRELECMKACRDQATPKAYGPWSSQGPALGFSVAGGRCYCNHKTWSDCNKKGWTYYKYFDLNPPPGDCSWTDSRKPGQCYSETPSGTLFYNKREFSLWTEWKDGSYFHDCLMGTKVNGECVCDARRIKKVYPVQYVTSGPLSDINYDILGNATAVFGKGIQETSFDICIPVEDNNPCISDPNTGLCTNSNDPVSDCVYNDNTLGVDYDHHCVNCIRGVNGLAWDGDRCENEISCKVPRPEMGGQTGSSVCSAIQTASRCELDSINAKVFCKCLHGYTGERCEIQTNSCEDNKCVHGTCVDTGPIDEFHNQRQIHGNIPSSLGYDLLEHTINEGPLYPSGKNWIPDVQSYYKCICDDAMAGNSTVAEDDGVNTYNWYKQDRFCSASVEFCQRDSLITTDSEYPFIIWNKLGSTSIRHAGTCGYGGECLNTQTGMSCICPNGYEINADGKCSPINPCDSTSCENNGVCHMVIEPNADGPTIAPDSACICPTGFFGKRCDEVNTCGSNDNYVQGDTFDFEIPRGCCPPHTGIKYNGFDGIVYMKNNTFWHDKNGINVTDVCDTCPDGYDNMDSSATCELVDYCKVTDAGISHSCPCDLNSFLPCVCGSGYFGHRCDEVNTCGSNDNYVLGGTIDLEIPQGCCPPHTGIKYGISGSLEYMRGNSLWDDKADMNVTDACDPCPAGFDNDDTSMTCIAIDYCKLRNADGDLYVCGAGFYEGDTVSGRCEDSRDDPTINIGDYRCVCEGVNGTAERSIVFSKSNKTETVSVLKRDMPIFSSDISGFSRESDGTSVVCGVCEDGFGGCFGCPPGKEGNECTEIDDCQVAERAGVVPCGTGGTCVDGTETYTCVCDSGYFGDECEFNTNVVQCSLPNALFDGLTGHSACSKYVGSLGCKVSKEYLTPYCECDSWHVGSLCQRNGGPCMVNACVHGDCREVFPEEEYLEVKDLPTSYTLTQTTYSVWYSEYNVGATNLPKCAGHCMFDWQCAGDLYCHHRRDGMDDQIRGCRKPSHVSWSHYTNSAGDLNFCAERPPILMPKKYLLFHHRLHLGPVHEAETVWDSDIQTYYICDCYNSSVGDEDLSYLRKQFVNLGVSPRGNLLTCEGDCDRDSDCADDLICQQRNGNEPVPWCQGSIPAGYDVCTSPVAPIIGWKQDANCSHDISETCAGEAESLYFVYADGIIEDQKVTHPGKCGYGGICTQHTQGFTCECPTGYEIDDDGQCSPINPCDSMPCKNNGMCQMLIEPQDPYLPALVPEFVCTCPDGFSGKKCDECGTNRGYTITDEIAGIHIAECLPCELGKHSVSNRWDEPCTETPCSDTGWLEGSTCRWDTPVGCCPPHYGIRYPDPNSGIMALLDEESACVSGATQSACKPCREGFDNDDLSVTCEPIDYCNLKNSDGERYVCSTDFGGSSCKTLYKDNNIMDGYECTCGSDIDYEYIAGDPDRDYRNQICESHPNSLVKCHPPLGECQGHCESDSDCADGLSCHKRSSGDTTPGCSGSTLYYDTNTCFRQNVHQVDDYSVYMCGTDRSLTESCPPGRYGEKCLDIDDCARYENENGIAPCVNGVCVDDGGGLSTFTCVCDEGFTGDDCSLNVMCNHVDCGNGYCHEINDVLGHAHVCECKAGWEGEKCDVKIDDCEFYDCHNGWCVDLGEGVAACVCKPGWYGESCSETTSTCDEDKCQGVCESGVCKCTLGMVGINCETNWDDCLTDPCVYGECFDLLNDYHCTCDRGFTGTNCDQCAPGYGYDRLKCEECEVGKWNNQYTFNEPCVSQTCPAGQEISHNSDWSVVGDNCLDCIDGMESPNGEGVCSDINECMRDNPCSNGAVCLNMNPRVSLGKYKCYCAAGYEGKHCDININECFPNPCLNGVECKDLVNDFRCLCPVGYSGKRCDSFVNLCKSNERVEVTVLWNGEEYLFAGDVVLSGENIYLRRGYTYDFVQDETGDQIGFGKSDWFINIQSSSHLPSDAVQYNDGLTVTTENGKTTSTLIVDESTLPSLYMYNRDKPGRAVKVSVDTYPCMNGGVCEAAPGTFSCKCTDGYYGEQCEFKI